MDTQLAPSLGVQSITELDFDIEEPCETLNSHPTCAAHTQPADFIVVFACCTPAMAFCKLCWEFKTERDNALHCPLCDEYYVPASTAYLSVTPLR